MHEDIRSKLEDKLENLIRRQISKKHIHHAIIALESGDKSFRWVGAAGEAHSDGTPMREDTPYFIASVTKLYIAASILKLHERNEINIENPVSEYLPRQLIVGLHILHGTDYTGKITIRHLLSHTTGLPDWLEDRPKKGKSLVENIENEKDRTISVEEAISYVRENLTPHFPLQPLNDGRKKVRYSDTNFQLLIAILEERTGKSLHNVFDELIYKPIGLHRTYHPGHEPDSSTAAHATMWIGDKPFEWPLLFKSFRDLISTVDDQLLFMRRLMNGELFQKPETVGLMQQNWNRFGLPRDLVAVRLPGWPIEYGLGMMRMKMPRIFTPVKPIPAFVGHTGVTGSWLFYCPELDLYLCGTFDQVSAAAMPFRVVPKLLRIVGDAMS